MIDFVLDQLGEIVWKAIPVAAASVLIVIANGDTPVTLYADNAIGNAETVVPDFELFLASPRDFRIDQSERSRAKIHHDDSLVNANLGRRHGAAETAALAEVVKRRVQISQLSTEIDIRPRNIRRPLFETRVADCQNGKRRGTRACSGT
jgi:hypothetical protein